MVNLRKVFIDTYREKINADDFWKNILPTVEPITADTEHLQPIRQAYIKNEVYPAIEIEIGDNRTGTRNMARNEAERKFMLQIRCIANSTITNELGETLSQYDSVDTMLDLAEKLMQETYNLKLSARVDPQFMSDEMYVGWLRYTGTYDIANNRIY